MRLRRLIIPALALWLVLLAAALQPRQHNLPSISHARPLEPAAADLPTLTAR